MRLQQLLRNLFQILYKLYQSKYVQLSVQDTGNAVETGKYNLFTNNQVVAW